MRILLDECVNPRLRLAIPGDKVRSVPEMGWSALTNGALMKATASRFDVLVTLVGTRVSVTEFASPTTYSAPRR
jgi:hypothetical protein